MSSLEDKLSKALSANEDSNEGDFQKYARGVTEQQEKKVNTDKDFDFDIPKVEDGNKFDFSVPPLENKVEDNFDFDIEKTDSKEEFVENNFDTTKEETQIKDNFEIKSNVKTTSLDKDTISDIITIYEQYKEMDESSKYNLSRFLNINTDTVEDTIYGILNVEASSVASIGSLISLFNEEPVSRVFTIVSMEGKELKSIENALRTINNKVKIDIDVDRDKIAYCKKLEEIISSTPESVVNLLKPVEKILEKGN